MRDGVGSLTSTSIVSPRSVVRPLRDSRSNIGPCGHSRLAAGFPMHIVDAPMIARSRAGDQVMFLVLARSRLAALTRARQRAGRDPLYGEPRADPEVQRLGDELSALRDRICVALAEAGLTDESDGSRSHGQALAAPFFGYDSRCDTVIAGLLDQGVAFYRGIVVAPKRSPSERNTMSDKQRSLDEKDAKRLGLLDAIYELTDGDSRARTTYAEAYELAGLDERSGGAATNYLAQEGLLDLTSGYVGLTPAGVAEREGAIRDPSRRTDHFSATAVQNVFHINAPVNVLQTGNQSVAINAAQRVDVGMAGATVSALLKDLLAEAQALPEKDRDEAVSAAKKIEEHATRAPLDPDRLKRYIELYSTIATVVSPALHNLIEHFGPQIPSLLGLLQ
jgi:hypothetical protein